MTSRLESIPTRAPVCPAGLKIEQVQILVRHGERTPLLPLFQNTGLSPYWPYCTAAERFTQAVMAGRKWEDMRWRRSVEMAGFDGLRGVAVGGGICMPGELTDKGRETSLRFGGWLRRRYIDQLGLLPKHITDPSMIYVRSSDVPRVIQSAQQILYGLYPTNHMTWNIAIRPKGEETLWPNRRSCRRLAELAGQFSRAAKERWNVSEEMRFLDGRLGGWMPGGSGLGLEGVSGIMDTINSTAAHGTGTRLPGEFYEEGVRGVIERIMGDEWFGGYGRSRELRMLGAGPLVGGMVVKMIDQVEWDWGVREREPERLSLVGCHDRTIGVVLASIGCLDGREGWPGFTSHVIFELFRRGGMSSMPREVMKEERGNYEDYFVRVKYNDRVMTIPGCRAEGSNFEGDPSLCTLTAFKSIVDKFTPSNWKQACNSNLGVSSTTMDNEPAGY